MGKREDKASSKRPTGTGSMWAALVWFLVLFFCWCSLPREIGVHDNEGSAGEGKMRRKGVEPDGSVARLAGLIGDRGGVHPESRYSLRGLSHP